MRQAKHKTYKDETQTVGNFAASKNAIFFLKRRNLSVAVGCTSPFLVNFDVSYHCVYLI